MSSFLSSFYSFKLLIAPPYDLPAAAAAAHLHGKSQQAAGDLDEIRAVAEGDPAVAGPGGERLRIVEALLMPGARRQQQQQQQSGGASRPPSPGGGGAGVGGAGRRPSVFRGVWGPPVGRGGEGSGAMEAVGGAGGVDVAVLDVAVSEAAVVERRGGSGAGGALAFLEAAVLISSGPSVHPNLVSRTVVQV